MRTYLYNVIIGKHRGFIPTIIRVLLSFLSIFYALVVKFLAFFRGLQRVHLPVRVVSVGNITLGGTGKTVLVEFLARYLTQKGKKVVVISRGYKRGTRTKGANTEFEQMGDEPCMLKQNLSDVPIVVGANRVKAALLARERFSADTAVLDDAFQQWHIYKDLDIVTIDAASFFNNQHMLPRGTLREPLSSLARADILVLTRADFCPRLQEIKNALKMINPLALIVSSVHKPAGLYKIGEPDKILSPEYFISRSVGLFSGIANPASLDALAIKIGLNVVKTFVFSDHYNYLQHDLDRIILECRAHEVSTLITTEKDASRILGLGLKIQVELFVLRIAIAFQENEKEFLARLSGIYNS
ncbi:MAG: tetraacyldisaccharide 4'-kinase [Candidatus Omnitrophota bacterium]|nr:tetraacyldisaccharide 4'-kinase [Candidatus Omnitrophota bacterium]